MSPARSLSVLALFLVLMLLGFRRTQTKAGLVLELRSSDIHADDLALIETHAADLSVEQLKSILRFLTDELIYADSRFFDVAPYRDWVEYNFERPMGDTVHTNLARRDLFLDPARQLNNPAITNMSDEALAALVFSQTYVEEKWDHTVPWDGDANAVFNWIQPELLARPKWNDYLEGDFLYRERVRYWFATFEPQLLTTQGEGDDIEAALYHIGAPVPNVPRLAGYSYPIGNQLYLQTAETLLWYADYLKVSPERYGFSPKAELDTSIELPQDTNAILGATPPVDWQYADIPGLYGMLNAPFAAELRRELSHPEIAAFWNVMRFVHAGARQREGGGSAERPGDNQPAIMALRYANRSESPNGRSREDISAFSLITTVYSDSILLDFTNWDKEAETLIVAPLDATRSDGIHRRMSERNKAIRVIEQMGDAKAYSHATHVSGSLGLGLTLVTQYDDSQGDFLPFTPEEAYFLARALLLEASDFNLQEAADTLCKSPLLLGGLRIYLQQNAPSDDDFPQLDSVCQS